jgi:hypothetical protein
LLGIGASLLRVMISDSLVQLWQAQMADGGYHCLQNNKTVGVKASSMTSLLWHCSNCYVTNTHDRTLCNNYCKGKAIPLQAWTGPQGSRRLRLPDFKTVGTWRL